MKMELYRHYIFCYISSSYSLIEAIGAKKGTQKEIVTFAKKIHIFDSLKLFQLHLVFIFNTLKDIKTFSVNKKNVI